MSSVETLQPDRLEQQVRPGNSPLVLDLPDEARTEELVDIILNIVSERLAVQEKEAFWSNALNEYNNFQNQTGRGRKHAKNLITQAATELLKNPQDITIAQTTWRGNKPGVDGAQEPKEPFSKAVKEKMLTIIREKEESVTPEQFAQLVRIYANKDESQKSTSELAKDLLENCLNGPKKSRRQRIDTYYNFVSGVLDLAEEKEAFIEGMKIALFATDIFPVNPSLTEQSSLLNFPHDLDDEVFQKLLIARRILARVCSISKCSLDKYYQGRADLMNAKSVVEAVYKRKEKVEKEIGIDKAEKMYNVMRAAMNIIASSSIEPTLEEKKQVSFDDKEPLKLAFNPEDPLNQKFRKVFSKLGI